MSLYNNDRHWFSRNYHEKTWNYIFCGSCMNLLYIFDRWLSIVVIDIGFKEISMERLETSFFVVDARFYCIYLIDESL